ncbi:MAG: flagellar type III secretion system pore protein FliP [Phycisphaerales bacterium]|nr:flagellar type III secretion system pore protein FliP [Phycisphaerales bacterium]MCB9857049.1 flagellar type III secretion system pore protein FliP [Phycisphaerales bacterium]MCB9861824.1 flagellar type III secretion system pore protein FliP [Phycisphaerales bacterium]
MPWGDRRRRRQIVRAIFVSALVFNLAPGAASAQDANPAAATPSAPTGNFDNSFGVPDVSQLLPPATDGKGVSATLKILVLLTVLSLAPSILIMMTSFTRILIVLSLLRQAIGTQQLPPSQVITGLALIMTMLVMAPTWSKMKSEAIDPYFDGTISQSEAYDRGVAPLRAFMFKQIANSENEEYVYLFVEYARQEPLAPDATLLPSEVNLTELIPAFVLSELKTAFVMGFRIYLPFLVIDMVIASILISMGMMMLPPVLISLPFKLMLFVLADGWGMVIASLLNSFV